MEQIEGVITQIRIYCEESRTDWLLSITKVLWIILWFLFPLSIFRFIYDLFGIIEAAVVLLIFLILVRLLGPANLVMLDELLVRIVPTLRSSLRLHTVRVYDFRIVTEKRQIIPCILRGDLVGSSPMVGDHVHLLGKTKYGCFTVHTGRNSISGAIISPRTIHYRWIFILTLIPTLFFGLYLAGNLDEWIYEWIIAISNGPE